MLCERVRHDNHQPLNRGPRVELGPLVHLKKPSLLAVFVLRGFSPSPREHWLLVPAIGSVVHIQSVWFAAPSTSGTQGHGSLNGDTRRVL